MPPDDLHLLYRAGLVHGWGRLGVSNAIWDKKAPLSPGAWERVRTYPYLTARMVSQSEALAPVASVAARHRERLDGSGYPWGLPGAALSRPARVLLGGGAAQRWSAWLSPVYPGPSGPGSAPSRVGAWPTAWLRGGLG